MPLLERKIQLLNAVEKHLAHLVQLQQQLELQNHAELAELEGCPLAIILQSTPIYILKVCMGYIFICFFSGLAHFC